MNFFIEFFHNYVFALSFLAYMVSGFGKLVICYFRDRRLNWKIFLEPGGMPSAHSALVCSLSTSIGKLKGFDSIEFAICMVFAAIIMYDALGVRRAAGEHATVLNMIVAAWDEKDPLEKEVKLKELLGHTPLEVMAGALFGMTTSILGFKMLKLGR